MKNLEKFGVQNLNAQEIKIVDGGCPMAWYMDDDTINQHKKIAKEVKESVEDAWDWIDGFIDGFLGN